MPSRSSIGSVMPPMHASTWQLMPRSAAIAAIVFDRVDHSLRVLRRGADDEHGVVVDRVGHRIGVGAIVVARPGPAPTSTPK